jgi:pilus assembly protein CpaF
MSVDTAGLRRWVHGRLLLADSATVDRSTVIAAVLEADPLLERELLDEVVSDVWADLHGMGPIEGLLQDSSVTDILLVGGRGVWVERKGVLEEVDLLLDAAEVLHLIERTVAPLGLRVDRSSPMVDARLPDGSRVNAVVPPLTVDGPCLTIRRFAARAIALEAMAPPPIASLLRVAVAGGQNILISGGTGAGKTSLMNTLGASIGSNERVVTIEDAAELRLPLRHVVRLEARPANSEGVGQVTARQLLRNALRMRPDRILVGEVRGGEALDMLQAMNTGHEGSMSTCHANSAFEALRRLETMVLFSDVALPLEAVRQQIVASLDLIVHVARVADGARCIAEICEVIPTPDGPGVRCLIEGNRVIAKPVRPLRRGHR